MSPEQARGQPVDKRADIWAFGCVLYEMLTRRASFLRATITDTLAAVVDREPDWTALPAATPPAVLRLMRHCLEKDPKLRLRDIGDARAVLKDVDGPSLQTTTASPSKPIKSARRSTLLWSALSATAGVSATLIAVLALRTAPDAVPVFDRIVRLVSTPAYRFAPAISPDGKWVAYLSDARGQTDVWVKFVAGGDPANLTASTGLVVQSQDFISGLDISPDGTQIAFDARRPDQVGTYSWVIAAPLGGVPRPLLKAPDSGLHWSPDGKQVSFTRGRGSAGDALGIADADGQNVRELVPIQNGRHIHWTRWSPDGQYIYFNYGIQNFNTEPTEVYRALASSGAIEPVVKSARRAAYPFPSPDGRGLYYAANPDSVDLSLWWRDFRTGLDHRLTTGVGEYGAPSVTPDGRRLVATSVDARQRLVRAQVVFDRPIELEPLTDGFTGDFDPSWSRDGQRLLFSSSRDGNRHIWTAAGNLTQPTPLTSGPALDDRPVFSPDGQQVAFVSDRGGRRGIWVVSAEGGAPRLVLVADVLDTLSSVARRTRDCVRDAGS